MKTEVELWEARQRADSAIRKLWLEFRHISDISQDALTEQDMALWELVTLHPAIQDRLTPNQPSERG